SRRAYRDRLVVLGEARRERGLLRLHRQDRLELRRAREPLRKKFPGPFQRVRRETSPGDEPGGGLEIPDRPAPERRPREARTHPGTDRETWTRREPEAREGRGIIQPRALGPPENRRPEAVQEGPHQSKRQGSSEALRGSRRGT